MPFWKPPFGSQRNHFYWLPVVQNQPFTSSFVSIKLEQISTRVLEISRARSVRTCTLSEHQTLRVQTRIQPRANQILKDS